MATQSETEKGQARRAAILEAARSAFLKDGFHATSMQDLFEATGTTPGAFYRYFPSKEALILALAGTALTRLSEALTATIAENPATIAEALAPIIRTIDTLETANGTPRLALLIWGEAQRSTQLAATLVTALAPLLHGLERLAEALQRRRGTAVAGPEDLAVVLGGLLQGYVVQRTLFGVPPARYIAGLTTFSL